MPGKVTLAAALAALAAFSGCSCDDVPAAAVTACESELRIGAARTDILFVVDESGSMSEEQENLRANLDGFVDELLAAPVRNDFQIGVTTTSVADWVPTNTRYWLTSSPNRCNRATDPACQDTPFPDGALVAVAQSGTPLAPVVGKLDWTQAGGFGGARLLAVGSPTLAADFKANVSLGIWGSGKEQPFLAARHALEKAEPGGPNAGFLRTGARLAIVFLTDEDDCSDAAGVVPQNTNTGNAFCHEQKDRLDRVADFATFLDGTLAGEVRRPIVAVIAGFDPATLAPSGCGNSFDDPTRFDALLGLLGPERSLKASICDTSFGPALLRIADLLVPQTVPLDPAPPDGRMLAVGVVKAGGARVACPVAVEGGSDIAPASAGAVFTPARDGAPATLTFQNACRLGHGDQVDVKIVCAG